MSSGAFPGCVWFGKKISQIVTESEVWLPAAQKSVKGPGWWKGKFLFVLFCFVFNFGGWQPWMGVGAYPKANNQWARAFTDGRRRLRATCRNSIVSSDSHPKNDYAVV